MRRILVTSNCDEPSKWSLKYANALSEKYASKIFVLKVIKTHGGAFFDDKGEIVQDHGIDVSKYIEAKEKAIINLNDWTKSIMDKTVQLVKYGGIADTISETISRHNIHMLIIGNPKMISTEQRFFGRLTSFLSKRVQIPILSLKQDASVTGIKNILYPGKFDKPNDYYDALKDISDQSGATVHLLHVVPRKDAVDVDDIASRMKVFCDDNELTNCQYHIVEARSHQSGIIDWIESNNCDLLAVKNITRRTPSPLFRKKLSQKIIQNMKISTLIYNDQ